MWLSQFLWFETTEVWGSSLVFMGFLPHIPRSKTLRGKRSQLLNSSRCGATNRTRFQRYWKVAIDKESEAYHYLQSHDEAWVILPTTKNPKPSGRVGKMLFWGSCYFLGEDLLCFTPHISKMSVATKSRPGRNGWHFLDSRTLMLSSIREGDTLEYTKTMETAIRQALFKCSWCFRLEHATLAASSSALENQSGWFQKKTGGFQFLWKGLEVSFWDDSTFFFSNHPSFTAMFGCEPPYLHQRAEIPRTDWLVAVKWHSSMHGFFCDTSTNVVSQVMSSINGYLYIYIFILYSIYNV